jgi:hypothetical protein
MYVTYYDRCLPTSEAKWPEESRPASILEALRGRSSDRKLRLFACACCRRGWDVISNVEQMAVAVAEQYADGQMTEDERWNALRTLLESAGGEVHRETVGLSWAVVNPSRIPHAVVYGILTSAEFLVCEYTGRAVDGTSLGVDGMVTRTIISSSFSASFATRKQAGAVKPLPSLLSRTWKRVKDRARSAFDSTYFADGVDERIIREWSYQAALLRDIFGNPFRPVAFDPAWRTSTAVAIAQQMYVSRDFFAMPILADALQDAGCDSDDVLTHCRDANGVHVRGCWVVDLVLGKA